MMHEVTEWTEIAEMDLLTAQREFDQPHRPNFLATCFHAQQCIEKYLKAFLTFHDQSVAKTHDLGLLLGVCRDFAPHWQVWKEDFNLISSHAIEARYPGEPIGREHADHALRVATAFRDAAREELELGL